MQITNQSVQTGSFANLVEEQLIELSIEQQIAEMKRLLLQVHLSRHQGSVRRLRRVGHDLASDGQGCGGQGQWPRDAQPRGPDEADPTQLSRHHHLHPGRGHGEQAGLQR